MDGLEPHRDELALGRARPVHPGRHPDRDAVEESEVRRRVPAPLAPVGVVVLTLFGE
jgi:hypothetical protein